ncbi:MAG: hypothetical protein JWQ35_2489 [Bacteriovoracaceae bacterium]|nr:hypothetical protein [Bacteriovoracaceae bacterium]
MFIHIAFLLSSLLSVTPPDQFVFNNGVEAETLDPHRLTSVNDSLLALQMFEGLVGMDSTYMKVEPAIASHWEVSKDGLKYTFTIRKGLKWSNGDALTPEQVRNSFIRAMAPEVANPNLENYTHNIEGAAEYVKNYSTPQQKDFEAKLGITLKGKDQIEIKIKKPSALFLNYLADPRCAVVHPSMWKQDSKAWTHPEEFIVNGPYKLKEWVVNKQIVLEKNKNYREASKVKIETIVALPINDQTTTYNLYRTKQIDWTGENTLASTYVSSLRADSEFFLTGAFGTYAYALNVKIKPLDNLKVRKALSLAIHRAEITDKVLKSGVIPTSRLVPPGLDGFKPPIEPPQPFDRQIEQAKTLLAQAGYPDGKGFPTLTLNYNTNEQHHKVAQAIQQMWKKYLNIDVKLDNREWKVFLAEQAQKKYEISRQAWIGEIPDAGDYMEAYLADGPNNHTNWGNAQFDRILRDAHLIRDAKKRNEATAKAEKIILDDAPIIPIYHYVFYSLMSPRIQGFKPNMFGKYQFKYFTKK